MKLVGLLNLAVVLIVYSTPTYAITEVSSTDTTKQTKVTDVAGSGDSITAQRTANNVAFIFAIVTAVGALVVLGILAHKNSDKVAEQSVDESVED
jgi:hypothetical protein